MPSFHVAVPHVLGQETARARLEKFLDNVQRDYSAHVSDVSSQWNANQLAFQFLASGLRISGTLDVADSQVEVSGPLPFAALLFRGQIESKIRENLAQLLT
jgi:hypothetical protein